MAAEALEGEYKGIRALGPVSAAIGQSEVLGLAGPNGTGKSTFSQIVAGFKRPSQVKITIGDLGPTEFRTSRSIGYWSVELPRPWGCTVSELLGLRMNSNEHFSPRALLARMKLEHLAGRTLRFLSKGEWRRIVSEYAFAGAPPLVVLDEPDSGLDPAAVTLLVGLIKDAWDIGAAHQFNRARNAAGSSPALPVVTLPRQLQCRAASPEIVRIS